jgi:hypothetical protein
VSMQQTVDMSLELNRIETCGRLRDFAVLSLKLQNKTFNATAIQLQAINAALEGCNAVFRDLATRRASDVVNARDGRSQ